FAAIPRKALVVVQFSVSIILIIGTIVVFKQIQFARNRPVGYSQSNLITTGSAEQVELHFPTVRDELVQNGTVSEMAETSSPLTAIHNALREVSWRTKDPTMTADFANIRVTSEYGKTVG